MWRVKTIVLASLVVLFCASPLRAQFIPPTKIEFPPFDAANCVQKAQHILVIDMKSGWWSGDGGELHHQILARLVKDCPLIDVDYYFLQFIDLEGAPPVPIPGFETGVVGFQSFYPKREGIENDSLMVKSEFPRRPWNEYHQIWLLSGGDHDPTDVPTKDEFFVKMLTDLTKPPTATPGQPEPKVPGLFIGAGLNHHDHANKLLAKLEMREVFQSHTDELLVPHAFPDNVEVLSRVRRGAELQEHALFEGLEALPDRMRVEGLDTDADFMPTADNPFRVIGQNSQGEPSIGVKETETRRFVVDAGVSRFYALFLPTEQQTYRYLHNIIKFLAR
jgi:hypothetical protein